MLSSNSVKNNDASSTSTASYSLIGTTIPTYIEPYFNLKISEAKMTLNAWKSLMDDKISVRLANVKTFLDNSKHMDQTWVHAAILVTKTNPKESQNGSKYIIWTLSDLKGDLKTVTVFLFGNAFDTFWKTDVGTILAFLNPKMKSSATDSNVGSNKQNLATFSMNSAKNIIVLGLSNDLGFCNSTRKDGTKCLKFLDKISGIFCPYHMKGEYNKLTKNQSKFPIKQQSNNFHFNQTFNHNGDFEPDRIVVSKPCLELIEKDRQILKCLKNDTKESADTLKKFLNKNVKGAKSSYEVSDSNSVQKQNYDDKKPIVKTTNDIPKIMPSTNSTRPIILNNQSNSLIDLSMPISQRLRNEAKRKAIEYVRLNGAIGKADEAKKRKGLMNLTMDNPSKKLRGCQNSEEFRKRYEEIKNMKSMNEDLVDDFQMQQKHKYFKKLEIKETIEKKLMDNFKVPCKAVRCLQCEYTSYSASENCKQNRHTLKVFDSFKRFFKCKFCSKRTVTLDAVIPTLPCTNCKGCSWEHTSILKEKRPEDPLSIRGHEEKFIK